MLMGHLKTYLPKTWRSSIGVLLGITAISLYTLPCMAENLPAPQEQTSASSMDDMQRELRALKAQVESLRAELGATKQQQEVKADEELFASKQEFSQLSQEVQGLKQQQPEVVATLKDQIKKEMGFLPNAYNELSNKIRLGMELRTRGEYENGFHTLLAHQSGLGVGQTGQNDAGAVAATGLPAVGTAIGPFNRGVAARKSTDQSIVLNRVRVNIDADVHEHLRAFVQFQDSRFWGMEGTSLGFLLDQPNSRIDLHQAYFDVRKMMGKNLTLRVGRQEIIWGAHRMMGDFGWSNIGFTWDAVRALWESDRYAFQAFGAIQNHLGFFTPTAGSNNTAAALAAGTATATVEPGSAVAVSKQDDSDHQTYGAMFTFKKLIPNATLELMYLMDNDQQERAGTGFVGTQRFETGLGAAPGPAGTSFGEMEVHDVGFRLPGKIGKAIDYEAESHFQFGEFRGQTHRASAHMAKAGYTLDKVMWSPRIGYEFDWSPGDGDPSDRAQTGNVGPEAGNSPAGVNAGNVHHTFHQFYPTNHAHFGYIDLVAWKNIQAHRLQLNAKHTKKLRSQVDFWYFDLDNPNDGWYNAGQVLIRRAPNAATTQGTIDTPGFEASPHLGKEVDFTLWYDLYKNVGIMAGYSRFVSGSFIKDTVSRPNDGGAAAFRQGVGGTDMDTDWGFLQMTVSF